MKAKTLDRTFDAGEKVLDELERCKAKRVNTDPKRVNADLAFSEYAYPVVQSGRCCAAPIVARRKTVSEVCQAESMTSSEVSAAEE